jgi:alpha-1,3-rhamnosyltransferase
MYKNKITGCQAELPVAVEPLVTIVIPSYNHARFLAQAIESVLSQTYKNIELIVIDDGSTDQSLEIINALAERYGFITKSRENRGLSRTLNEGIELATGKYICFLASDDYYLPQRIENAALQLKKSANRVAAVYCDGFIVDDDGKKIKSFGKQYSRPLTGSVYSNLLAGNWIPALGMTYKLEKLKEFMFDERFKIEDYSLYLTMFKNDRYELTFYQDFDFAYRRHEFNFSKFSEKMDIQNTLIEDNFEDLKSYTQFKQSLKSKTFFNPQMTHWRNYYILYLQAIRILQQRSSAYHRSVFGLLHYYLLRLERYSIERAKGFRYFGLVGFKKKMRISGHVKVTGRVSNFHFGRNCRILGDLKLVLEDTWHVKPSVIIGDDVTIDHNVYMNSHGGSITVGSHCHFGVGSVLQGRGGLTIGDGVLFGPCTRVFASNHRYKNINSSVAQSGETFSGISIGSSIWIGSGCTILDGAVLGDNSVYGAGGIVTGNYAAGTFNIASEVRVRSTGNS